MGYKSSSDAIKRLNEIWFCFADHQSEVIVKKKHAHWFVQWQIVTEHISPILVTGQSIGPPLHIFNIPTPTFSDYIYLHQKQGHSCSIAMCVRVTVEYC